MRYPVITIGRQHGSGGRTVAEMVAKKLDIPLYDKLLIQLIAKESGFAEEYIKDTDMRRIQSFFYGMYIDSRNLPLEDQLYIAQSKVIKEVSDKGPCVIVGRCADYVLRERKDVLHVFIHQLADVPHKPFRIDHWRRRLRRALHEQTARFVAVALRQSDENVDEVSLLGFFELVYEAGVEENELGMGFAEAK